MDIIDFIDSMDLEDLDSFRDCPLNRVRIDPFQHYTDFEFKQKYGFSKYFAQQIVTLLKDDLPSDLRGGAIPPGLQVACALRCWAQDEIQDSSGESHGISQQVVSKICKNVAEALAKKADSFINMPSAHNDQENIIRDFKEMYNFPGVIGAIGCTYVQIKRVPRDSSKAYINKKGFYSLTIQIMCDAKLKIRDIVVQCRESDQDSRIFYKSSLKEKLENADFNGRLLGDCGYACTPYLFTPLLNPCSEKEHSYNKAHLIASNTIERCFGLWKQRFRCLLRGMHTKLSTAITTIVALAVLHNIAIDMNEDISLTHYVQQHTWTGHAIQDTLDTLRGDVERRNFINEYF